MEVATPEASPRSGAGPPFYDARRAALAAVRAQPRPPRPGPARGGARRRPADRHPEHRRPARAGRVARASLHMHGSSGRPGAAPATPAPLDRHTRRPAALPAVRPPALRPGVVWFGEMPYGMDDFEPRCAPPTCSWRSALRAWSTPPRPSSSTPPRAARHAGAQPRRQRRPATSTSRGAGPAVQAGAGLGGRAPRWPRGS